MLRMYTVTAQDTTTNNGMSATIVNLKYSISLSI